MPMPVFILLHVADIFLVFPQNGRSLCRLSSSCPSLNVEGEEESTNPPCYFPWSEEFLLDARKGPADASRRRSWSGLSDTEKKRARQRSVSLSSFDSDGEEPFYDAEDAPNDRGLPIAVLGVPIAVLGVPIAVLGVPIAVLGVPTGWGVGCGCDAWW
ncbi:uncharacterized protein LOC108673493 [Hyalella azteca]|uniref:Uncharacterized protein LOC108673493 n=1 Tax=Hyalella azteca TaxID=294128 RepID=A0A979FTJ5_HYAAZ|nr:uncharacterized protein LOC108673493 [Hyalella azteca]